MNPHISFGEISMKYITIDFILSTTKPIENEPRRLEHLALTIKKYSLYAAHNISRRATEILS